MVDRPQELADMLVAAAQGSPKNFDQVTPARDAPVLGVGVRQPSIVDIMITIPVPMQDVSDQDGMAYESPDAARARRRDRVGLPLRSAAGTSPSVAKSGWR